MSNKQSDTIEFWKGEFGNYYCDRNNANRSEISSRIYFWSKILSRIHDRAQIKKVLEVGCNIGLNIQSLKLLLPAEYYGIEPNDKARELAVQNSVLEPGHIQDGTSRALPFKDGEVDLAFTVGVLIHVPPDDLEKSLREIYRVSSRYIVCSEYFADTPTEINYRGHQGVLFKRDFGGLYMDLFPDLQLVDYGFEWKRQTGLDNMTWWIFRK